MQPRHPPKPFPVNMAGMRNMLLAFPGTASEHEWLTQRLETLTAKEAVILTAMIQRTPPNTSEDVINLLLNLRRYVLRSDATGYHELAHRYLEEMQWRVPASICAFVNYEQVGKAFEQSHPGVFVDGYYVEYPPGPDPRLYSGKNLSSVVDDGWIVKVKLASSGCPEGVWIRLPDFSELNHKGPNEEEIACDCLGVHWPDESSIVEARCVFPEAGNLTEQYDDPHYLISDTQMLGICLQFAVKKQNFKQKYTAIMEYAQCHTLQSIRRELDLLDKYEFVIVDTVDEANIEGSEMLHNPDQRTRDDLEKKGYQPVCGGDVYIRRSRFYPKSSNPAGR